MNERLTQRILAVMAAALVSAGLFLAGTAGAQTFGRVKFLVKTGDGEPVPGVQITVSCQELGKYNKVIQSNKKGEAVLSVVDATKTYQILVEHEGYPAVESEVKPKIRQTIEHEILLSSASRPAAPAGSTEARLTPAQEAFNAGVVAAQEDDIATARAKFQESIELDDKLSAPHLALAGLYHDEKNYEAAITHATRLAELDPDNTRAYRILHDAHTQLGNKKEAREALDVLAHLGAGEDSAAVVYNEGVAALRVGDSETAKTNFLKALELQEDLVPAMSALALVYYEEKSYEEAAAVAARFLAAGGDGKNDQKMLRLRWESFRALGDTAREKEAFDALAASDPRVLVTEFFNAGAKLYDAGDTEGARDNFEKVLAIDPEHPRAHYQLALCLVSSDAAAAKSHFEKFLELAPDDPEAPTAKEMLSYLE